MDSDSIYPDILLAALVGDDLFAAAYARTPANFRALLKTSISRLYQWYGPAKTSETHTKQCWRQGFVSLSSSSICNRCAIFCTPEIGPATLLAALVPALSLGVPQVCVVFVGPGPLPDSLLTALELAGQETVFVVNEQHGKEIVALHAEADACVLVLGQAISGLDGQDGLNGPAWSRPQQRRLGIWRDEPDSLDLEALAFAHPDAEVTLMGDSTDVPEGFVFEAGGFDEFLSRGYDGLFVPQERATQALDSGALVLGPGHEACWLHTDLFAFAYTQTRVAWLFETGDFRLGSEDT